MFKLVLVTIVLFSLAVAQEALVSDASLLGSTIIPGYPCSTSSDCSALGTSLGEALCCSLIEGSCAYSSGYYCALSNQITSTTNGCTFTVCAQAYSLVFGSILVVLTMFGVIA